MDEIRDAATQPALRQALEIAGRHELPIKARSLTRKEYIRAERSAWGIMLGVPAFFFFVFPFYLFFNGDFALAVWLGPWLIGLALLLWLAAFWLKRRAGRNYVDPRIEIEVAEEGISFRAPGRLEPLSWVAAAEAIAEVLRRGGYFDGLRLDSPIGALALDNSRFKWGRTAAAAVYGRCVATGALPPPDQAAEQ